MCEAENPKFATLDGYKPSNFYIEIYSEQDPCLKNHVKSENHTLHFWLAILMEIDQNPENFLPHRSVIFNWICNLDFYFFDKYMVGDSIRAVKVSKLTFSERGNKRKGTRRYKESGCTGILRLRMLSNSA